MAERATTVPKEGTLERALAEYFLLGGPAQLTAGDVVQIAAQLPAYLLRAGFVLLPAPDAKILADALERMADTFETYARTNTTLLSGRERIGLAELGRRVRVLRREAARLRGHHG